jgi:hypothetical protein
MKIWFWLFFLCTQFQRFALAQPQADSSAIKSESQRLGINTFSSGHVADWRGRIQNRHYLQAQAGQYWVYNRALPSNRFIINNLWNSVSHQWQWKKRWKLHSEAWQTSFFANQTRLAQGLSLLSYSPFYDDSKMLVVSAGAGVVNDKRLNNNNNIGPKFQAGLDYWKFVGDTSMALRCKVLAFQTLIAPRKNDRILAETQLSKNFQNDGLLSGEAGYLKSRVEDFLGNDIQSIASDTVFGRVKLRYLVFKNLVFTTENMIQTPNRTFFYRNAETQKETRNVRYFQDEYQSLNTLRYQQDVWKIDFSFESKVRNRTYDIINRLDPKAPGYLIELQSLNQKIKEERIKDIREQTTTYTTDARTRLGKKHVLRFHYVAQLLRVDTRSELNNQDRDEILYSGELSHEWMLWNGFRLINKYSGSFRHLIFIEASQSSENFVDRIIRWEPGFRWVNKKFSWSSQMGIWATYQVRDFENQQDKNRSNRVLIFSHQAEYWFDQKWKLLADLLRRENRLSQLNWERFSESPIDTVTIYDLSLKGQYAFGEKGEERGLQWGYRAYWQVRKAKASLLDPAVGSKLIFLRTVIIQQGPQIRWVWSKPGRYSLSADFWLQWSSQYFTYKRSDEVFLGNSYTTEQLAFRDHRFLPYFTINAIWFLKKR